MPKTALITGSSNGIGAAIAQELAEDGYKVFLTGRNCGRLQAQAHKCHGANYLVGNLLDDSFLNELIETAKENLGQIDILVNNAGTYLWSPTEETEQRQTKELLKLNLQVPLELCRLVVPAMKRQEWGRIINIGSISGAVGEAKAAAYSASKAGLIGLSKALALELAQHNITVNTISPGWVKTALVKNTCEAEVIETVPQRRWVEPAEVAAAVRYLASDRAQGITGQNLNICAGLSLG
jgi:NAD(P)-dependent dehydrogenase (short-subunit alcohol dehydrogenase family)